MPACLPVCYTPACVQALTPLIVGGRLVIARPDGHMDADHVMSLIADHGVSFFVSTPSLALVQFRSDHALRSTKLRSAVFGGETLPREVIALVKRQVPQCLVYNVYGPTEATITASELPCPPTIDFISIGRPVHNMHAYVVDGQLRAVPVGVPGELLLSGPRLATGYVGRPDLTAEKFISNPCLDLVRENLPAKLLEHYRLAYRTGDLVRWRPDGTIEFLGRIDRQVKVNGVRIELGEVEAALGSAPGVAQAVASAVADDSGAKRLVGYVSPASAKAAEILAHCRTLLVPAMVPSIVVALDAFPLMPNGKVDVKALPPPDWGAAGAEEYVAPASELESTVQRVWQEVLGRGEDQLLSVTADFFAAGGTSMQVGAGC